MAQTSISSDVQVSKFSEPRNPENLSKIASVLAATYHNRPSFKYQLQPWAQDEDVKNVLSEITLNRCMEVIEPLLCRLEASVYGARNKDEDSSLIGVALLFHTQTREFGDAYEQSVGVDQKGKPVRMPETTDFGWRSVLESNFLREETARKLDTRSTEIYKTHYAYETYKNKLWELSFVAVDEAHRRKRISKALVQAALNEVPAGHYVLVEATPDVEPFFEKMGFRKTPVPGALYNEVTIVYGPTENPPNDEKTTGDGLGEEYHDNEITTVDGSTKERVLRFVHMVFQKPSEESEERAAATHTGGTNISRRWRWRN